MSTGFDSAKATCPYCGEGMELLIDPGAEHQEYVEDCWVCCRPMVVTATLTHSGWEVWARAENE